MCELCDAAWCYRGYLDLTRDSWEEVLWGRAGDRCVEPRTYPEARPKVELASNKNSKFIVAAVLGVR
jgi:hypothetical protein